MRSVFRLTMLGGLFLLTLSIWPGMLEDVVFNFAVILLWMMLIGGWVLF